MLRRSVVPSSAAGHCVRRLGLVFLCALAFCRIDAAAADPADLCDRAAVAAARATGVPLDVLQAIAMTETGRRRGGRLRPWPWATNAGGAGRWFESRENAEAHIRDLIAGGQRSIDIGCFQVNLRWHGHAFAGPEAMLEPAGNAIYAARFLAGLAAELGSWEAAAGAYHSRTPELAERYAARFRGHLAALQAGPVRPPVAQAGAGRGQSAAAGHGRRPERPAPEPYPLLAGGAPAGMGSLVPLGGARGAFLMAAAQPLR